MNQLSLLEQVDVAFSKLVTHPGSCDETFISLADDLSQSSDIDHISGGLFTPGSQDKQLGTNANLIATFGLAANFFANPDLARIGLQALGYILSHHRLEDGYFSSLSSCTENITTSEALKTNLDDAQWQALQCYFDLPDHGTVDWTSLSIANPRTTIHSLTGLHPKQVPLALDGALQILQFQLPRPYVEKQWTVRDNLLFCRALFIVGIYLNQQEKGEIAEQLFQNLIGHFDNSLSELWLDVMLLSLRHNWDQSIYEMAKELELADSTDKTPAAAFNQRVLQHLLAIEENKPAHTSECQDELADMFNGIVLITGPAHLARQWLQQLDNQVQFKYRYFARPGEGPIQAQVHPVTGSAVTYTELDALYSLQR
jgi:hypothetical protein